MSRIDRVVKRAGFLSVLLLADMVGAHADYYDVTDVDLIRPPRPQAMHQAAVAFCEKTTQADQSLPDTPAFKACMLRRGYRPRSEHLVREPQAPLRSIPGGLDGTYIYDDAAPGPERSEGDQQAATLACDGGVTQKIGTSEFNACMRARHWDLANFEPAGNVQAICRVADPTGTPLNLRSGPAGKIEGNAALNGTLVSVIENRPDPLGKQWALIARYPHGVRLGWVFRNYLSCF